MKITFITTINHNIGDDFVREGIKFLVKKVIGKYNYQLIHKHLPITVRPEFEWIYFSGLSTFIDNIRKRNSIHLSRFLDSLPINKKTDKILNCNLLIQSGAPVFWCFPDVKDSYKNEWFEPLIIKRYSKIKQNVPLLNLGAGSCLPYYSNGEEFNTNIECTDYIKNFISTFTLTTVRDSLSKTILKNMGFDIPLVPCPSLFARDELSVIANKPEYIVLNYMPAGGHYYLGQNIDPVKWENNFISFYNFLKDNKNPLVIVCHNQLEVNSIKKILPHSNIFFAKNALDYLKFYSKAKFYIGSRVHGAFITASFGRPAFVIGNDTRAHMMKEIGLESNFVNNIDLSKLKFIYNQFNQEEILNDYSKKFIHLKEKALDSYISLLKNILK